MSGLKFNLSEVTYFLPDNLSGIKKIELRSAGKLKMTPNDSFDIHPDLKFGSDIL